MSEFQQYRRRQITEMRPVTAFEVECGWNPSIITVSTEDIKAGSPRLGDMIARYPQNRANQWLVAAKDFADNFKPIEVL